MTVSVDQFRTTYFPEYADTTAFPETSVQSWLDRAGRAFAADLFGMQADDAQAYLAAHLLTLDKNAKGRSGIASFSAGGVSVAYAMTGGALASTPYGQQFIAIRDANVLAAMVV